MNIVKHSFFSYNKYTHALSTSQPLSRLHAYCMLATETIALKAVVYHLYAVCLVLNCGQLDIAGRAVRQLF